MLEDSRQVLQPVWLQSAPGDTDEVPYDLVQSSLLRARSGWAGLQLQNIEGVGHDIGQFEASILNEFLRQHASDAYFEVEGLDWDEFEIEIDVGPPIPGINA